MRPIRPIATSLLALMLVGCGMDPTETPRPRPTPRPTQAPVAPPTQAPTPGGDRALIQQSYAAFKAMRGYQTELSFMQKNGAKTANGVYEIAGRTPRRVFIHIKSGNNTGVKLLWEGGAKVRVRAGGLLGAIALELPKDDDRFLSVRKYSIDQTDLHALYAMMTDPTHTVSPLGPDTVAITGPNLLKGCIKMVVRFDLRSGLPQEMELSDAKEVVYSVKLKNFRRNDNVSLTL